MKTITAALALLLMSSVSTGTAAAAEDTGELSAKLESQLNLKVSELHPAAVEGLYEAITDRGVLYVSRDGRYILSGSIYDLDKDLANITEQSLARLRKAELAGFKDSMIVFPAKQEKYRITVFTDITCGYCRKLHSQMAEYNSEGITVQYLAFPRGGLQSPSYSQMQAVWCADDRQQALSDAKQGKAVSVKECDDRVAEQYRLGMKFGVSGTPAIVLEDGTMVPGYRPPRAMAQLLAQKHG